MFGPKKIKIDKELLAKIERYAKIAGYSSPDEFVNHALEKELAKLEGAEMEILRHNLNYLRLSAVPMLWMIVPFVFVIAQLQFHYGYRGLTPGQDFIVKVQLKDGWEMAGALAPSPVSTRPAASLQAPPG